MTASVEISPKKLIDSRYRIQRQLGQGGFGRTYLVQDERRFGELCVLKEFAPGSNSDATVTQKLGELFQREAKILHRLDHPQIPKFLAWFRDKSQLFIVQEYVNGKTYWELLQDRKREGRAFAEDEVVRWLKDLLPVVAYIHDQNIIHRDISPDNVMLPEGKELPVLIDFGVVKPAKTVFSHAADSDEADPSTEASVLVGKYGYAPYEQIYAGICSPRSDVYALGVSALVLLTGRKPSQLLRADTLEWKWQEFISVDVRLAQILSKMVAKEPPNRYPSARAVLADLQQLEIAPRRVTPSGFDGTESSPSSFLGTFPHSPQVKASELSQSPVGTQVEWAVDAPMAKADNGTVPPTVIEPAAATQVELSEAGDRPDSPSVIEISRQYLRRFQQPRWKFAALGVTAAGMLTFGLAGVQSSQDASICLPSGYCIGKANHAELYQRGREEAEAAQAEADEVTSLDGLKASRDRLQAAVQVLQTIPQNTKVYPQVAVVLPRYQKRLSDLEQQIETETQRADILNRAEIEAKSASASLETAETIQDQEDARRRWRTARSLLQDIPSDSLAYREAQRRSQQYQAEIDTLDRLIAHGQQTGQLHAPEPASSLPSPEQVVAATPGYSTSNAIRSSQSMPRTTVPSRSPSPSSQTSRVSTPAPRPSAPAAPSSAPAPAPAVTAAGGVPLMAAQSLDGVSIRLDGAHVNTSGTFVANLVIENRSDRAFGFVPVYGARVETARGQEVRSRVSFGSSNDLLVQPGGRLTGQLFVLGQSWKTNSPQNLVLVVQEGTTGGRMFQISF